VEPNNPATYCLSGTGTEMHSGSGSNSGSGFGPRSNIKRNKEENLINKFLGYKAALKTITKLVVEKMNQIKLKPELKSASTFPK